MPYQVAVAAFHGPLDLLLYLVKRDEVDILDIRIAELTAQFLEYLKVVKELDVEAAGDFLVMAATLMVIKSRSLVPKSDAADAADAEPDPRRELVKQLLEYRKYKDAARQLEEAAEAHSVKLARTPEEPTAPGGPTVRPVELWDLVAAFARLVRETQGSQPQSVITDDTPQQVYEDFIRDRVRANGRVRFQDVFAPPFHRARLIGLFLAVLELIRRFELTVEQPDPFGDIWLGLVIAIA